MDILYKSKKSDTPLNQWVEIEGTDGGLYAFLFSFGAVQISADPNGDSADKGRVLATGTFIASDEVEALVKFLTN